MAKKGMPVHEALEHLDLTTDATEADVKRSYKDLARIWHPDRFQSDERLEKKAEEQIKVINEARSVALAYVKKHGHFRFVNKARARQTAQQQPPPPPPPKPPPKQKPKPPPRQEAPKTEQARPKTEKARTKPPPKQAPPKQEEYRPPPEPEYDSEYETYTDHMPGQNFIIAGVLVVILAGFVFLMMSTLKDTNKEKVEAYLAKREEMKKTPLERRVIVLDDEEEAEEEEVVEEADISYADTFFTLGSDKEWVSLVQGAPFQIKGDVWKYGFSTITFNGSRVVGWKSSELHPLSVGMLPPKPEDNIEYIFGVGTNKKEVAAMYGAPDIINGDIWTYGEAYIRFKADTIIFWQNDRHNTFDIEFEDDVKHQRIFITTGDTLADTVAAR